MLTWQLFDVVCGLQIKKKTNLLVSTVARSQWKL